MIRPAVAADAPALLTIYAPAVETTAISFETELPSAAAMRARLVARLAEYPWLVWEAQGEVLGYAYAGRFRERAAYDWIAETSVYVHAKAQRCGIGAGLYRGLLAVLRRQGIRQAMGVITLPNASSVSLHERLGFVPAGLWQAAGYKHGRWWDVGLWQAELTAAVDAPPPLTPFPALPAQELTSLLTMHGH